MASKKQKRQAALEKREQFMAVERERGLAALSADRAARARRERQAEAEAQRRRNSESTKLLNKLFAAGRQEDSIQQSENRIIREELGIEL